MDFIQTLILALVQGITEFLPISSSGHLVLTSHFLGWEDQGAAFDLALNVGTLLAVVLYFRKDLTHIICDTTLSLIKRKKVGTSDLGWMLVVSTIPAAVLGLLLISIVDSHLRYPWIILLTTWVYAFVLWIADRKGKKQKTIKEVSYKHALIAGFFQALALIPGTSRSGITISAMLFLGYDLKSASRFSFLMSMPIIFLATGAKITSDAIQFGNLPWVSFLLGFIISFITAILTIHFFLKWVNRFGMMPYVWYRVLLGFVILGFIWVN